MASALDAMYAAGAFGEVAEYTPPEGGAAVPIRTIVSYGKGEEHGGADAPGVTAGFRIRVSEAAQVRPGGALTIGSAVWEVVTADLSSDGLEWVGEMHKR